MAESNTASSSTPPPARRSRRRTPERAAKSATRKPTQIPSCCDPAATRTSPRCLCVFFVVIGGHACVVVRTPGQTRQARDGRRGPPGGAWAGPGAHCGVGPAWVLGLFIAETPSQGARWSAKRHSLSRPSQVAKAPYCALLSAQPRPAAGRATPWPGPPCDRPPQSASVEEVSRLA